MPSKEASCLAGRKVFMATAQAYDAEMETGSASIKHERGDDWDTHEEPMNLAMAVRTRVPDP